MGSRTAGNNNSDLTEMNRSVIVKILQRNEICSRAEIAKMTGLTQASITKIVAVLIEMGIVSEVGAIKGNGNRRSIGLRLNAEEKQVIGVKFSRHMFAVGVFDISGKLYAKRETEYKLEQDAGEVLAEMKRQIHETLKQYPNVVAIGMAVPGPYLRKEGRIAMVTKMPKWHNVNFIDEFKEEFNRPLFIEQDANAGALAEWWFGDHETPLNTLAYLLAGEGVGSGVVDNDNLLLGTQGVASEVGHISINVHGPRCECGNYGCLELYSCTAAMLKRAEQELPELLEKTYKNRADECAAFFALANEGNKKALKVVEEIAAYLGYGCVSLINAYNPDIIVIGDIMAQCGDILLPPIEEIIKERVLPEIYEKVRIRISGLGVDPTLCGAAAIATDRILRKPSEYLKTN